MTTSGHASSRDIILILILISICLAASCAGTKRISRIEPLWNSSVCELTADQVVALMREAGFTDSEILSYGTDLRNALAIEGGAKIMSSKYTEVIMFVQPDYIYIVRRGQRELLFPLN